MTTLNWNFAGDETAPEGYSYVARCTRDALRRVGVDLDHVAKTAVFHTVPWPGFSVYPGQRLVIFSMWEHSQVPVGMAKALELFEFAIAPCRYSADLFSPFVKCEVAPHGIDPHVYFPAPQQKRPERLTILTAATNLRKGAAEVVEGVRRSGIPATVVLKGRRAQETCEGADDVEFLTQHVSSMRDLYRRADLYVSGAKGEGWDLIAFEALACGVPTIVPAHTAYLDWMHLAQATTTSFHSAPSQVKQFGDAGTWLVSDPDDIAEQVTRAWEHYDETAASATASAYEIRRSYTWEHTAAKIVEVLENNGFTLDPFVPRGSKQDLVPMVRCRFLRDTCADVGGYSTGPVRAGIEIALPNDVARVLTVSGAVEPLEGELTSPNFL